MITRKSFLFLLAVGVACLPFGARAAQFAFGGGEMTPVGASEGTDTPRGFSTDMSPRGSLGGDGNLAYSRASIADTATDDGATVRSSEVDAPVATPAATPRNAIPPPTPAAPNRARSGNRWQSLVPGAIK